LLECSILWHDSCIAGITPKFCTYSRVHYRKLSSPTFREGCNFLKTVYLQVHFKLQAQQIPDSNNLFSTRAFIYSSAWFIFVATRYWEKNFKTLPGTMINFAACHVLLKESKILSVQTNRRFVKLVIYVNTYFLLFVTYFRVVIFLVFCKNLRFFLLRQIIDLSKRDFFIFPSANIISPLFSHSFGNSWVCS